MSVRPGPQQRPGLRPRCKWPLTVPGTAPASPGGQPPGTGVGQVTQWWQGPRRRRQRSPAPAWGAGRLSSQRASGASRCPPLPPPPAPSATHSSGGSEVSSSSATAEGAGATWPQRPCPRLQPCRDSSSRADRQGHQHQPQRCRAAAHAASLLRPLHVPQAGGARATLCQSRARPRPVSAQQTREKARPGQPGTGLNLGRSSLPHTDAPAEGRSCWGAGTTPPLCSAPR